MERDEKGRFAKSTSDKVIGPFTKDERHSMFDQAFDDAYKLQQAQNTHRSAYGITGESVEQTWSWKYLPGIVVFLVLLWIWLRVLGHG